MSKLSELEDYVFLKGGVFDIKEYVDSKTKIKFKCKNGHIWMATPSIAKTRWCKECHNQSEIVENKVVKCLYGHEIWGDDICFFCRNSQNCPSKGEEITREMFSKKFNRPFPRTYPTWTRSKASNSRNPYSYKLLDGYNDELKLGFDYNPRKISSFKYTCCQDNGVKLYTIPAFKTYKELRKYVGDLLGSL